MEAAKLHAWEEVYKMKPAEMRIGGISILINRVRVPGGWIYIYSMQQRRWGFWQKWETSTVFVSDTPGDYRPV